MWQCLREGLIYVHAFVVESLFMLITYRVARVFVLIPTEFCVKMLM